MLHLALALALVTPLLADGVTPPRAPDLPPANRWLVQLTERSFDLAPLREAIVIQHDKAAALALIEEFEARAAADQLWFRREVERRGGRVLRHWWIVNACWIEALPNVAGELASLPGVGRVERDDLVAATDNKPLDHFNHGAEIMHGIGLDGRSLTSAILAVVDSGIDVDMNGVGRPHRAFYTNGDPTNLSGGGIGGSRIVFNNAFGALPADDAHGHGTSVAAIAAGSTWGTPNSVNGHAKGALIAGYGIGDQIQQPGNLIFAFFSTMTTAWQQMLVDRATNNIVVAVNSFQGSQDPLQTTQQALDACALNGDILIVVGAGNDGPGAMTGQQSCVNGLAVASVSVDSHVVEDSSSRGPVVNDPSRTYPDLAAIVSARVPTIDCETVDGRFFGTSAAAPRVAGAAMTLRASVPTLSAIETKATLLATALDVAGNNPGLDSNAFGMGLARQDLAMLTAADVRLRASDSLTTTGQTRSLGIPTTPGQRFSVALAWMRGNTNRTNWSDLNLRVIDPFTTNTIASSNSPRNLYEKVTFAAPPGGLVLVEVSAITIENSHQDFAVAVAPLPVSEPQRDEFSFAGPGCEGPQINADAVHHTVNDGARPSDLSDIWYANRFEHAIELTAPPGGITVTGFELFTRSPERALLETAVFLDDGTGQPTLAPMRTGTMQTGASARFYRTTFAAPITIPAAQKFYLGVGHWSDSRIVLNQSAAPQTARMFFRDRTCARFAAWGGSFFEHIGVRSLHSDLQRGDVPRHETTGGIRVGEVCTFELERAPASITAVATIGFSDTTWSGGSLPFDLSSLGGTNCFLRVDPFINVPLTTNSAGETRLPLLVRDDPFMVGWVFYSQFILLDGTSPRRVTSSNSGRNVIGTR